MRTGRDPTPSAPGLGRREWAVLAAVAAVGLGVHAWFALGADAQDADRSLVLLMARHFAQGDLSLYFWQQNYMGALEPLLLTPLALVGLATPVAAAFVGIAVTAALAWLSLRVARRLEATAWLTLLLWAIPPAVVAHHHVALYGGRLAATLLVVGAFTWSLGARSTRAWVGIGALVGVAYFGDHLMLPWAVAVAWVAVHRGWLAPLAVGAVPVVVADTVAAMLTPAVHVSGPNDPESWLHNIPLLFGTTLPQLFGLLLGRGPTPVFQDPAPVVPPPELWLPWVGTALPGLAVLLLLGGTLVRRRRELVLAEAGEGAVAVQALCLAGVTSLGIFALVGGGGDVWPARYLVPLWPAITVLAGLAVSRWSPGARPLAALAVLPALFTLSVDDSWPRGGDRDGAHEEAARVALAVEASGVQAVWADYWDAYRLALLVSEDPPWLPLRIIERRPDWLESAQTASPVGYLVRTEDREVLDILAGAPDQGIAVLERIALDRYHFVVTQRPVPEALLRHPPPPRGWQMLAALGAGLLFVGTLPTVAGLRWLLERRR